ncbi:MAG: tRNA (adenosine(37)-N6)-threonylcarbamoyltransferase complex ATPase subunit type 1 TsaE [Nannocystaceae bacterium]
MIEIGEGLTEAEVTARARALGRLLQGGEVLLLEGSMGAGKTTFVRALAGGLGVFRPERVSSPTFALCLHHPGPIALVHLDLHRLGGGDPDSDDPLVLDPGAASGASAEALGLASGELEGPGRVICVEWPDRWISPPEDHLKIAIDRPRGSLDLRTLRAVAGGPRSARTLDRWIVEFAGQSP